MFSVDSGSDSDSDSDDSECSDDDNFELCMQTVVMALVMSDTSFFAMPMLPGRVRNDHRDRAASILTVWSDDMFQRQFRLCRSDFNFVLQKIYVSLHRDEQKVINSSGSVISLELKLSITWRDRAGAAYLDMIWYSVSVDHVIALVVDACCAIHRHIQNIQMPTTDIGFIKLTSDWQRRVIEVIYANRVPNHVQIRGASKISQCKEEEEEEEGGLPGQRISQLSFSVLCGASQLVVHRNWCNSP